MDGGFVAAALGRRDGGSADGVHLMWTVPPGSAAALDGWRIQRRDATGRPKVTCRELTDTELAVLHRVLRLSLDIADIAVRQVSHPDAGVTALASTQPPARPIAYRIRLPEPHRVVEIHAGVAQAQVIALRDGKAVAMRVLGDPSGTQHARFDELGTDEVQIYTTAPVSALTLCLDVSPDPEKEEAEWAQAKVLADHLQIPIRELDPALATRSDERASAKSRLLPGEVIDEDVFDSVADLLSAAAKTGDPLRATSITAEEPGDPFIELGSWSYALALLVDPAWRRMLGFGLLDPGAGLTPGNAYDYRITGRFPRHEFQQSVHGFHIVPRGTTLPETFSLGPAGLTTPVPVVVELDPAPAGGDLTATGRKGIALQGDPCLTLSLPWPVRRVTVDLGGQNSLEWRAETSPFLPGFPSSAFGGPLPAPGRFTIETSDPVSTIELRGTGFLLAVGLDDDPLAVPAPPDDVVIRSVVLSGVVFEDTPAPVAPAALDTTSLQEPVLPGVPAQPPQPLGLRLSWEPPPPAGTPPGVPMPPDLGAFPPFDALNFELEHRRADTGDSYAPLDTVAFGSRGGQRYAPPLIPGIELEDAFPDRAPPPVPVAAAMSLDDARPDDPPGSEHQYRIRAVDVLGRRSAPVEGVATRLEKHRSPPVPANVTASVLQHDDPDLGAADRALLGLSTTAIVLEWAWTSAERDQDPLATEFRVYWQPIPPDTVTGAVTGPGVVTGPLIEVPARFDQPVTADALRGSWLRLSEQFEVAGHPAAAAGQDVTLQLEPSRINPSLMPGPGTVEVHPVLTGAEQRPAAWAERVAVIPITGDDTYQHIVRDVLVLDAGHPRAHVWIGVSTADDQNYVPDAFPGGTRPGNESAVAPAPVQARYRGRPEFVVPPPLPDVPELVTAEPAGPTVSAAVELAALLPAVSVPPGHLVQLERIALGSVIACLGTGPGDMLRVAFPDGAQATYTLPNPGDHAAALAQVRSGVPASVEGRFLMDLLLRFPDGIAPLWKVVLPQPVPFGTVADVLPQDAERHVHRIRLADPAGHRSAGVAVVPQIVRVPSLRSPGPPQLRVRSGPGPVIEVEATVRDAFDLAHVVLFADDRDGLAPADDTTRIAAQLLRLPNRRDLYPDGGIRVRLADGSLLGPAAVLDRAAGAAVPPDRVLTGTLASAPQRRVALWGVAMTRDGIPSRLAGPVVTLTAGGA